MARNRPSDRSEGRSIPGLYNTRPCDFESMSLGVGHLWRAARHRLPLHFAVESEDA